MKNMLQFAKYEIIPFFVPIFSTTNIMKLTLYSLVLYII